MIFSRTKQKSQKNGGLRQLQAKPKWLFILQLFLFVGVSVAIIGMSVFVWGGKESDSQQIDFDIGLGEVSSSIVNLEIIGHDDKKRFYVLTAVSANPKKNAKFIGAIMEEGLLSGIEVSLKLKDGRWFSLRSQQGSFNSREQRLLVGPNFDIYTSNGYQMSAVSGSVDLKNGTAIAQGRVEGFGPLGEIRAAAMNAKNGGNFIRFYGGVEVLLLPTEGNL